jgi:hypothetical protein
MSTSDQLYKPQSLEQTSTPPKTPPGYEKGFKLVHPRPESEEELSDLSSCKRRKIEDGSKEALLEAEEFQVLHQEVLLLHAPKQQYAHTQEHPVPEIRNSREMLVSVHVVGLNPIDWKAP